MIATGPRVGDEAIRLRLPVGEGRSGAWRESSTVRNPYGERKSRNKHGKLSFHWFVRPPRGLREIIFSLVTKQLCPTCSLLERFQVP